MYLERVSTYKARQAEILQQVDRYEKANKNFYITANLVMYLAMRAREIFESSEVGEKQQLLNLVFQNLELKDGSLSLSVRKPFLTMMEFKKCPEKWGQLDSNQRKSKTERFTVSCNCRYAIPPLKTMLEKGIEPSTVRLQGGCSTVELLQQLDENFIAKSCFTLKNYLVFYFQRI